jgi:hypothetical protein
MNAEEQPNEPPENSDQDKAKIYSEETKEQHTSHWDMDYMTTEQIEQAYQEGEQKPKKPDAPDQP